MDAEFKGEQECRIGILVTDDRGLEHQIEVAYDGEIVYHGTDDYPHDPADRTDDEQRIMSQVEARARYEAQMAFPKEDILAPLWNPHHIERGIDALAQYSIDAFREEFRPYFEALDDPFALADHDRSAIDDDSIRVFQAISLTPDDQIDEIDDPAVQYHLTDGTQHRAGSFREDLSDVIVCSLPQHEFHDEFDYDEEFHEMIMIHLFAQIRDIYLHMGEVPPEEYQVEGIGKPAIFGGEHFIEWADIDPEMALEKNAAFEASADE